jgi:HEAT repeat protein
MLAGIPELQQVLRARAVDRVVTAVIGDRPLLHPHRAAHLNPATALRDPWHKETHGGFDYKPRNHRPHWAMLFYFPQATTGAMGPTALVPGSHCLEQLPADADARRVEATGPAGTCVLIHYELWHRRLPGQGTPPRFLVKFELGRVPAPAPTAPQVDADVLAAFLSDPPPAGPGATVASANFAWLAGRRLPADMRTPADSADLDDASGPARAASAAALARAHLCEGDVTRLVNAVHDEYEPAGITAAYALAAQPRGPGLLADALTSAPIHVARRAAYALASCVDDPVRIATAVASPHDLVRQLAALVVAEAGARVGDGCVSHLRRLVGDASPRVRVAAVEAAGTAGLAADLVDDIAGCLDDGAADVRIQALIALARTGPAAASTAPRVRPLLSSGDRYVAGFAVEALARLADLDRADPLVETLRLSRWCPHTTGESPW